MVHLRFLNEKRDPLNEKACKLIWGLQCKHPWCPRVLLLARPTRHAYTSLPLTYERSLGSRSFLLLNLISHYLPQRSNHPPAPNGDCPPRNPPSNLRQPAMATASTVMHPCHRALRCRSFSPQSGSWRTPCLAPIGNWRPGCQGRRTSPEFYCGPHPPCHQDDLMRVRQGEKLLRGPSKPYHTA